MQVSILDNIKFIKKIDTKNLLEVSENLYSQCEKAAMLADKYKLSPFKAENVVIAGMGGSAIAGDILKSLFSGEIKIPVSINRNYTIPEFTGSSTLFIAVSYSGRTEETISAYQKALKKDAKIITIASGGKLKELAGENNHVHIDIPAGFQPRTAIAYLFFPLLKIFTELKLISNKGKEIQETIETLKNLKKSWGINNVAGKNFAKKLACSLKEKIPLICGTGETLGKVSLRWKTQLNENSKRFALYNLFPELCHNEIIAIGSNFSKHKIMHAIILRDKNEPAEVKKRVNLTLQIIKKNLNYNEIYTVGKSSLARTFSLIYLGDLVSIYLAILNKIDPVLIKEIDWLKKRLMNK